MADDYRDRLLRGIESLKSLERYHREIESNRVPKSRADEMRVRDKRRGLEIALYWYDEEQKLKED